MTLTRGAGRAEIRVVTTFVFNADTRNSAAFIFFAGLVLNGVGKANRVGIALASYLAAGRFLAGAATSKAGATALCAAAMKVGRAKTLAITALNGKTGARTKGPLVAIEHPHFTVTTLITVRTAAARKTRNTQVLLAVDRRTYPAARAFAIGSTRLGTKVA